MASNSEQDPSALIDKTFLEIMEATAKQADTALIVDIQEQASALLEHAPKTVVHELFYPSNLGFVHIATTENPNGTKPYWFAIHSAEEPYPPLYTHYYDAASDEPQPPEVDLRYVKQLELAQNIVVEAKETPTLSPAAQALLTFYDVRLDTLLDLEDFQGDDDYFDATSPDNDRAYGKVPGFIDDTVIVDLKGVEKFLTLHEAAATAALEDTANIYTESRLGALHNAPYIEIVGYSVEKAQLAETHVSGAEKLPLRVTAAFNRPDDDEINKMLVTYQVGTNGTASMHIESDAVLAGRLELGGEPTTEFINGITAFKHEIGLTGFPLDAAKFLRQALLVFED